MNSVMKFEKTNVAIIEEKGEPLFEVYSTGAALGQIKYSKGKAYPRKDRIDENLKSAEISAVVRNGQLYITESQLYDLMLEMKTDKVKPFRKWVTSEVLPSIRKTGSYSNQSYQQMTFDDYQYFDKTFRGQPVLSTADISAFLSIDRTTISYAVQKYLKADEDYYLLKKSGLTKFKLENPKICKSINSMYVITQSGFDKLCRVYGVKVEKPKCFIEAKSKTKKTEYCCILDDNFIQEEIERCKNYLAAIEVAINRCNKHNIKVDEMEVRRKTLEDVVGELSSRICVLAHYKLRTTTEYKF